MDTQPQIVELPWQDWSLLACPSLDSSGAENQMLQHQGYFTDPITTSSILQSNEEAYVQENDNDNDNRMPPQWTTSHLAPLVDLHMHFQDLPTFVRHPDFDHFAYCWMESQYHIGLSKHVEYRPTAMAWFASTSVQLAVIAASYPSFVVNEEAEASTPRIKAAYQRLVHYFNVMYKVMDAIERGRACHRSPQEIMLPIFNQLLAKTSGQQLPPITVPSQPTSHHLLIYESSVPAAPLSMPPSLNHSDVSTPYGHPLAFEFPPDHQHLLPHDSLSLSNPITPNGTDGQSSFFWYYPTVTDQHQQQQTPDQPSKISSFGSLSPSPMQTIQSEESESTLMHLDSYHRSPYQASEETTPEDQDSEYQQSSMDEDDEDDDDDDDGQHDYGKENDTTDSPPARVTTTKRSTAIATTSNDASDQSDHRSQSTEFRHKTLATSQHHFPRRGRTATSYDDDTTHFLKTVFFNIYSQRDKLTKDQRRQVVERTGLKPRNVTYWFSNHKRRFQAALDVFKRLVAESNGRIQTYDDFIQWRRENGLPEDITDNRT